MHVNLTPHYTQYIARKVRAGRYSNASEVIRAALCLMEKHEDSEINERGNMIEPSLTKIERDRVRRRVQAGIAAIDRGDYDDYDSDGLHALIHEWIAKATTTAPTGGKRAQTR